MQYFQKVTRNLIFVVETIVFCLLPGMCHLHSLPLHISNLTTASSSMNVTPTVISRKCQKFHSSPSHIMYNINYHFQIYVMLKEMHFGFVGNTQSQYVLFIFLAYTMFKKT